jgi:alpha-glucosidase
MNKVLRCFAALVFITLDLTAQTGSSQPADGEPFTRLITGKISSSEELSNGIEITTGPALLDVRALRDNVIRVRVAKAGKLPEDASWAVLPDSRKASVQVVQERDNKSVGFRTGLLRVRIDRVTSRLAVDDLQGNVIQEDAIGWPVEFHGETFRVYKTMPADEHYFGLGDKVGPLDRRGQAFSLWNTDAYSFQESTDPIYKSIPYFWVTRGGRSAAVLFDNTWRSSFDFGKQNAGIYSFGAENGPVDYYLLYGPDPKTVASTYAWLTGPVPLPPLWTLGYQQSRYSYETETQLREIASRLRNDKIPADVLYLDIDFQLKKRPFTIDPNAFPNFSKMVDDLGKQNLRLVAITDMHIAYVPSSAYTPFDSGVAGDHFVKNPDGSVFVGGVWPGPSVFPDFTRSSTRRWWGDLYKSLVADGVAGFWNDMNEPSVFDTPTKTMPESAQHRIDDPRFAKRTATHSEIHNVYGMLNTQATYEGLLRLMPDKRPFVLTRATYAGGQRYAATWTGDNSSTWNHLRLTTPMLLNLGLSGFGMAGADVGGFIGTPSAELLTKWLEIGAFQPIFRNHTEKGTAMQEPWVHGPEHLAIRRRYIEERYRILPYLYTAMEEMSRTGIPALRPLFMEFPQTSVEGVPIDVAAGNQFLFGSDLLVAPAPFPDRLESYSVHFPGVDWYDYWSGKKVDRPKPTDKLGDTWSATVKPRLEELPVYVREGAIIPIQPLTQSTAETPDGPMTVRVYPGTNCRGSLYQDDGSTMAYRRGEFLRIGFKCEASKEGVKVHIGRREGTFSPWWKQLRIEVFGWKDTTGALSINGKPASADLALDPSKQSVTATILNPGEAVDLEFTPNPPAH